MTDKIFVYRSEDDDGQVITTIEASEDLLNKLKKFLDNDWDFEVSGERLWTRGDRRSQIKEMLLSTLHVRKEDLIVEGEHHSLSEIVKGLKRSDEAEILVCPRCSSPGITTAGGVSGWLTPQLYVCKRCSYVGRIVLSLPKDFPRRRQGDRKVRR